ncbi:Hypothetical predicted protein [Mytilus galloprovincialis]|uniref:Uncharacterized protein n=2 Tax=Mytilus galloprovincialis TaxID=29158 RepID=A0A8B6H157_MYTGA|nr:Hypothetical predicted protein [Mytilus galloprovincialis]
MESLKKHFSMNAGGKGNETETSKSKFFLDMNNSSFMSHVVNGYEGVVEYIDAWKKFDGAGTHLIDSMQSAVKGTCYENLGQETSNAFKSVHSSSNGIDPSGKLREMENLLFGLKNQLESGDENDRCHSNLQILCRCLLLFLKVQLDYHQMCSATVASLLSVLVQSYECSENKDILLQMSNLDIIPPSPRQSPSRNNSRKKQNQSSYSPKLPTKQNTLKSSFLSLFERKNSPDESSSGTAFYVDISKSDQSDPPTKDNQKVLNKDIVFDSIEEPHGEPRGDVKTGILVQIGPDPTDEVLPESSLMKPVSPDQNIVKQISGKTPLASAEELDSVINLLSACGTQPKHMETIHENQLTVPSIYTSRTPSPGSDEMRPSKVQPQRHSEGSLDFSGMGGAGRNTWPHRSSLPSVALSGHMNYHDMMGTGGTLPRRFSHELNRPNPNFLSPQPSTNALTGSNWSFPDYKYGNRTWPMNSMSTQCSDTLNSLNSSWSAIQDSDELSDDSSCGEQFFAVGLDLVHAMDSKNESSDEETDKQVKNTDGQNVDILSSVSWSQKQSWPSSNQTAAVSSCDQGRNQSHRPLSMQWSDPLANRNMWPSASGLQNVQNIPGFGHLQ